jgi:tetratricopeptide (TPR) repeat protein
LDPNLAESHLAAARLLTSMENNRAAVEEHVRRALVLDPKDAFALDFAAQLTGQRGEFNKAVDLAKQAIDRDPADPGRYGVVADIYYHAGRYEDALAAGRKAWELAPSLSGQHWFASKVLFAKGEVEHALAELDLDPDAKTEYCLGCGFRVMMYDALNRKKDAEEALSRLKRDHSEDGAFEFARIYAQRGQLDLAFEWFDRAIAQQDDQLQWVKFDPLVNNVQRDPRFKELLHKLGLPD